MQKRNCPICGSNERHKIGKIDLVNFDGIKDIFDHQDIMGCNRCGAVFHEGIDMEQMERHYSVYTGGVQIQAMTADEVVLNNNMADFVQWHLRTPKEAKILDVGCGYGWVIGILKERGYTDVAGMDTDEPLMRKLKENGFSVECGNVYSSDKEGLKRKYDVILLKMVMEHLENPVTAIENVRRWLAQDGILVIEVPDCSLYDKTAFFPGYFQSVNMEHINNFSAISLMNLMRNWRMIVCESTDSSGIFPVLRMAFRYEDDAERNPVFNDIDEKSILASLQMPSPKGKRLLEKVNLLQGKACVIWGISAFTRGMLTYTELKEMNIAFFVDRNPCYQKKTLLGKLIVAPEKLKGFDGTIVIPGKNSEQIIMNNIRQLGYENEVICLSD